MDTDQSAVTIAGYIAFATPISIALVNLTKVGLEWLKQRHTIKTSRIDQAHRITNHYLDRALDPAVPLAIRHQLLRFLSTPDKDGSRLSDWANSELKRVEGIVEESNKAVAEAEKELLRAQNPAEIKVAESKLALASSKRSSLLGPRAMPPVTAAALKAGLIGETDLTGLVMKNEDLAGVDLFGINFRGSDFSGSNLTDSSFSHTDLRGVNFNGANLTEARFRNADLRGATLIGACLKNTILQGASLEGADLSRTNLEKTDCRATFNEETIWPEGFDPVANGAVKIAG